MKNLIQIARDTSEKSYVPYSNDPRGAALKSQGGQIYTGFQIDNKNLPNTIHAEEAALVEAIRNGEKTFSTIATTSPPCGKCLQMLLEFSNDGLDIIFLNKDDEEIKSSLGELLPGPHYSDY